ncbi:hypothetical protein J3998_08435 [Thiomicrorhabdus sp. 6S2-11]|uniref:Uncharacterized protein n=1 Tax=Thiomicrorhabdus marina TaxID=2818442 RepID=A0ABS3Q5N9_9GAMM|nr:hypothetical protein [Thiomicrorhabdus marina]MBO1927601.1 hypothetical protein [Thiomicrorhabdus marina]
MSTTQALQIHCKPLPGLMHFRGANMASILEKNDAADLQIFQYRKLSDDRFIANLGAEEIYFCVDAAESLELQANQYAFPRADATFELSGNWKALMSEVCIYDFRQSQPGDFLMVSIAGVSAWLLIPEADEPLILGCDPTFGHYFQEILMKQIEESPFL